MPAPTDAESFALGDFTLQSGITLPDAQLSFKTFGTLNDDKSNVIVYPTWYSGWHTDNEWLVGTDKSALNPDKWFIVIPNMLGNGVSSSPSNTPMPYDRSRFPHVSVLDQVAAQHKLLTEHFGIAKIALVTGWSMGAGQTYQWAVSHPEMVERAAPFCGSSVTAPHNKVFLESLWTALMADAVFDEGDYSPDRPPVKGLQAFARIYAGWGFSQAFYWAEEWRKMGYTSYEDFRFGFWERFFRDRDPNNLIALLRTWHAADVGATPGFDGDTQAALRSIRCPLLAMPGEKDLYFPPEDEKWASQFIEHGEVLVIPGIWGHFAGGGANPVDIAFIDEAIAGLLNRPGLSDM